MFRSVIALVKIAWDPWSQKTEITVSLACRKEKQADGGIVERLYHRRFAYFHQSEPRICEMVRSQFRWPTQVLTSSIVFSR